MLERPTALTTRLLQVVSTPCTPDQYVTTQTIENFDNDLLRCDMTDRSKKALMWLSCPLSISSSSSTSSWPFCLRRMPSLLPLCLFLSQFTFRNLHVEVHMQMLRVASIPFFNRPSHLALTHVYSRPAHTVQNLIKFAILRALLIRPFVVVVHVSM